MTDCVNLSPVTRYWDFFFLYCWSLGGLQEHCVVAGLPRHLGTINDALIFCIFSRLCHLFSKLFHACDQKGHAGLTKLKA
jgi:hypothetical protein